MAQNLGTDCFHGGIIGVSGCIDMPNTFQQSPGTLCEAFVRQNRGQSGEEVRWGGKVTMSVDIIEDVLAVFYAVLGWLVSIHIVYIVWAWDMWPLVGLFAHLNVGGFNPRDVAQNPIIHCLYRGIVGVSGCLKMSTTFKQCWGALYEVFVGQNRGQSGEEVWWGGGKATIPVHIIEDVVVVLYEVIGYWVPIHIVYIEWARDIWALVGLCAHLNVLRLVCIA